MSVKICSLFLCLWLILMLSTIGMASSADSVFFSNAPIDQEEGLPRDAVMVQKVGEKYCLFLPGYFDIDKLYGCVSTKDEVTVDGEAYGPDSAVSLTAGKTVKIMMDGKNREVMVYQGSAIHAVFLNSVSGSFETVNSSKSQSEKGSALFVKPNGYVEYEGKVDKISMRGNTSLDFAKKNYNIKLARKADIGEMGLSKKWSLVSNVRDHSLLRNQITYDMAKYVDMRYTIDMIPCDVWLNHEYNGEYIITERVEIAEDRVDTYDLEDATKAINEEPLDSYPHIGSMTPSKEKYKCFDIPNDPEDITGGYLVEFENVGSRYEEDLSVYITKHSKAIVIKEPEAVSEKQAEYISRFMQGFENAIFSYDGVDPESGKHYYEFVDLESLVLKYMLEEISKNSDANLSSQYYVKPPDSESTVAFAGPAWDYDLTYGGFSSSWKSYVLNPLNFYANRDTDAEYWWGKLCLKKDFMEAVNEMWKERYKPAMNILLGKEKCEDGTLRSIDEYVDEIRQSAEMNFVRWPMYYTSENPARTGLTYSANIDYLKTWIEKRLKFLDKNWK